MRIVIGLAAGLALAAAAPALALTITSTPNVEQAQRLQAQRGGGGPSLGDAVVGGGRRLDAAGFSRGAEPARGAVTYGFGDVTTTIRMDEASPYGAPRYVSPRLRPSDLPPRR